MSHGLSPLRPGCSLGKGLGVWQEQLRRRCRGQASAIQGPPPGPGRGVSAPLPSVPSTGPSCRSSGSSAAPGPGPRAWQLRLSSPSAVGARNGPRPGIFCLVHQFLAGPAALVTNKAGIQSAVQQLKGFEDKISLRFQGMTRVAGEGLEIVSSAVHTVLRRIQIVMAAA